jgi:hypothetical protein
MSDYIRKYKLDQYVMETFEDPVGLFTERLFNDTDWLFRKEYFELHSMGYDRLTVEFEQQQYGRFYWVVYRVHDVPDEIQTYLRLKYPDEPIKYTDIIFPN